MDSPRVRHAHWLVGPLVTLAAVAVLLVAARFYEHLPVHPPECGFRKALGLPCVGCGGTRSIRALVDGRLAEATRFNPAVVVGAFACTAWAAIGIWRYWSGAEPPPAAVQNRRLVRNAILVGVLLLLNWIYLLLTSVG